MPFVPSLFLVLYVLSLDECTKISQVFIDSAHNTPSVGDDDKDANGGGNSDFFESHSNQANNGDAEVFAASSETSSVSLRQQPQEPQQKAKSAATSVSVCSGFGGAFFRPMPQLLL